jgi:hypothetical protein
MPSRDTAGCFENFRGVNYKNREKRTPTREARHGQPRELRVAHTVSPAFCGEIPGNREKYRDSCSIVVLQYRHLLRRSHCRRRRLSSADGQSTLADQPSRPLAPDADQPTSSLLLGLGPTLDCRHCRDAVSGWSARHCFLPVLPKQPPVRRSSTARRYGRGQLIRPDCLCLRASAAAAGLSGPERARSKGSISLTKVRQK